MTYFEHTRRDLANAKKEVGEALLALADDTVRKMNDEEVEHDRTYLLEDLLTRIALVAKEVGADLGLFPNVEDSMRVRPAYELLDSTIEGAVVTNEIGSGETTRDLGAALYSSTHVKTTAKPGHLPRIGITRVEEGGFYK